MVATGGSQSPASGYVDGDYKVHWFHSSAASPFTVTTEGHGEVEYLIVAGGGGAGDWGGGGGGGGYRAGTGHTVTEQAYSIVVGAGGTGQGNATPGLRGANSSFDSIVATGGGGGNSDSGASTQGTGGSGGGGTYFSSSGS